MSNSRVVKEFHLPSRIGVARRNFTEGSTEVIAHYLPAMTRLVLSNGTSVEMSLQRFAQYVRENKLQLLKGSQINVTI